AYRLQEIKLQNRVHSLARKDKTRYDIEDALEEQFRAQEGGLQVTEAQLKVRMQRWTDAEATGCPAAMPSLNDLEQLCLRQKGGKAPGPDAIPNEIWKLNPPKAGRWLWHLCTQIALSGREPSHFKKALQCALYKKGPASLPSNYRSIALLNGVAKIWHSHIRSTLGAAVISGYDSLQLGGRKRIPVAFAVTTFRNVWELSVAQGFCCAAIFVDIQAAYYETSRQLLFHGDGTLGEPPEHRKRHLTVLSHKLARNGALTEIGIQQDELDLLLDCVACSHWQMVGSNNIYLATRGSRPGDGLADVLFGALLSVALRHIRHQCKIEGITHAGAGQRIGHNDEVVPVGWADDLAVLADFESPAALQAQLPRMADIVISTLEHIRFRVNLGVGKTEVMVDIRGTRAKQARPGLLTGNSALPLPDGRELRISPEYRYLGVIQQPRDNGRRDQELCRQRAQSAWAQARSLYASTSVPWELKQAWLAARILPAAYATLATNTAFSRRATAPLEGFFERATRVLAQSWQYGHVLTKPSLYLLAALPSPEHASVVAKVRLDTVAFLRSAYRDPSMPLGCKELPPRNSGSLLTTNLDKNSLLRLAHQMSMIGLGMYKSGVPMVYPLPLPLWIGMIMVPAHRLQPSRLPTQGCGDVLLTQRPAEHRHLFVQASTGQRAALYGYKDIPVSKVKAAILAPLAVLPEVQSRGIGGQLIRAGLQALEAQGASLVFVLGHPTYYPKHGFKPAGALGFEATYPIEEKNADAWMVQALSGASPSARGRVQCCAALDKEEFWVEPEAKT
ncbi:yjhQ, partial [Symbiodinium sp. CCMP2456]